MSALAYSFVKEFGVLLYPAATGWVLAHRADATLPALNEAFRLSPEMPTLEALSEQAFEAQVVSYYQLAGQQTLESVKALDDEAYLQGLDLESLAQAIPENEDLLEREGDAPVIRLINAILSEALNVGASDIHIETYERQLKVRFRVDGVLREVIAPKRALAPMLISRIKVMAKLDIAEKRLPQDGRILLRVSGQDTDVRVSTLPSTYGERVVLRLLSKAVAEMDLEHLGMRPSDQQRLRQLIEKPNGIVLVTGPTGSGKTTSLYAALNHLNHGRSNIMTVEDPVEYHIDGVAQTQVNSKAEMTFAKGLRAILRQDPDVVMIGEIRDLETAEIAVQASLTGHMVLSTLHTNSAIAAVTRLQDMGIEPFLLSSSVVGVVAQRLVRRLCEHCKQEQPMDLATQQLFAVLETTSIRLYQANPQGCEHCHQGYRGRLGIYEIIDMDAALQRLIHDRASEQVLAAQVRQRCPSLRQDGLQKAALGLTSIEEVLRVTSQLAAEVSMDHTANGSA
ncbi:Type II secretion system protein E [Marinomonas aquimarina]|uniref:Type II secretion system protein E n=1 Tax=Marinomonas aquimarina TaxID=295068 RepID=A0A1A8TIU9_9GAMM|nr:type II secretion system ATPase GspE [Marinomonas aquimarina]SBS32421.1 Type II secretion system protein E [Marinomonas aquimarina]